MNCEFLREQFSAYLDGELDPKLASQVKAHVDSCDACRRELDSLRELTGMLHELPREAAPAGMENEVVSSIERDALLVGAEPAPRRMGARVFFGAGLTAAALLVGLGVYLKFYAGHPADQTVALTDLATRNRANSYGDYGYRGGEAAGKHLENADGTAHFWMDGDQLTASTGGTTSLRRDVAVPAQMGDKLELAKTPSPATPAPAVTSGATAAFRGGIAVLSDVKNPARPEVFELQLTSADPDATRARIVAAAESLQIRSLNAADLRSLTTNGGTLSTEASGHDTGDKKSLEGASPQPEEKPADAPAANSGEDPSGGKDSGNLREEMGRAAKQAQSDEEYEKTVTRLLHGQGLGLKISGGEGEDMTRVVVLAVPEDKLQQFVAKLAPERTGRPVEESVTDPKKFGVKPEAEPTKAKDQLAEKDDALRKAEQTKQDKQKAQEEAKKANEEIMKELYDELDKYDAEDKEREKMIKESPPPEAELDKIKGTKKESEARKPAPAPKESSAAASDGGRAGGGDVGKGGATAAPAPSAASAPAGTVTKADVRKPRVVYISIYLTRSAAPAATPAPSAAKQAAPSAPAGK